MGDRAARRGLSAALADLKEGADWGDVGPRYRTILFGIGEENSVRRGLSRQAVAKVWGSGGQLSLAQLLRCRVRYFSDGMAIGRAAFVEQVFASRRELFSAGRDCGARRLRGGGGWGELRVARALRVRPVDSGGG